MGICFLNIFKIYFLFVEKDILAIAHAIQQFIFHIGTRKKRALSVVEGWHSSPFLFWALAQVAQLFPKLFLFPCQTLLCPAKTHIYTIFIPVKHIMCWKQPSVTVWGKSACRRVLNVHKHILCFSHSTWPNPVADVSSGEKHLTT